MAPTRGMGRTHFAALFAILQEARLGTGLSSQRAIGGQPAGTIREIHRASGPAGGGLLAVDPVPAQLGTARSVGTTADGAPGSSLVTKGRSAAAAGARGSTDSRTSGPRSPETTEARPCRATLDVDISVEVLRVLLADSVPRAGAPESVWATDAPEEDCG